MSRWVSVAGILSSLVLAGSVQAQAETKWDLSGLYGASHPVTQNLQKFADDVKERTKGELVITVRPAGELPFRGTEMLKAVGEGQVQLGEAYASFISGTMPISSIATLPFLVRTPEQYSKILPIIVKYTDPEFEKFGVKSLFNHSMPVVNVFGNGEPIRTIKDLEGRKIRALDSGEAEFLSLMGAAAVTLTTAEVPAALERGVADGFLTASFNVNSSKWYEFTDWAWMPQMHVAGPTYVVINKAAYEGLSSEVRSALDAAAAEWGPRIREENFKGDDVALKILQDEHHIEVVYPSDEEVTEIIKRVEPYWETWAKQHGPNVEAMLKEIRAALAE